MTATRSNRIAQVLLIVMGFFVGIVLAIIVSKALLNDTSVLTKQQRKLDVDRAPVEYVRVPGIGRVAYQFLFEELSESGESLDAFAARVAPRLRAFSDATGFEACGVLATDGQRFGAVIGSNHSHVSCVNFHGKLPENMRSTGKTIHSHGKAGRRRANANDLKLMGGVEMRLDRTGMMGGQSLTTFSEMDFAGGPGYLAIPGGTIFQDGAESSVRRIIDIHRH